MQINGFTAVRHDRFQNNAAFILASSDLSGVGRSSSGRWATLIGNKLFATANHFPPGSGETIRFFQTNNSGGTFYDAVVDVTAVGQIAGTDMYIGKLTTAPPIWAKRYAILNLDVIAAYIQKPQIGYYVGHNDPDTGVSQLVGTCNCVNLAVVGGTTLAFFGAWDISNPTDNAELESGDSGGPVFAKSTIAGINLYLIGTHYDVDYTPTSGVAEDALWGYHKTDVLAACPGDDQPAFYDVTVTQTLPPGGTVDIYYDRE